MTDTHILIGWKQIAKHLQVDERTALRYKKQKGLPVVYDPCGHPIIKKNEVERWRFSPITT